MSSHNRSRKSVPSRVALPNIMAQYLFVSLRRLCYQEATVVTVNKLPDDVFLEIFDFYLNDDDRDRIESLDEWHTLVHVCRRWRNLVFASPRRLNLQLLCTKDRPVREMLDIWPALPIAIKDTDRWSRAWGTRQVNIMAALEHPDRVHSIELDNVNIPSLRNLTMAMRVPFPELTHLDLCLPDARDFPPLLCASFLAGSAPRLRTLKLSGISFPAVPNLLLSATDLVDLTLWLLPYMGQIPPASMVAYLSSLNRFKSLTLGFQSPQCRLDQPNPPPQPRVVLPALTSLAFKGMTDYSEDFLARIDTPVLDKFSMSFFLGVVDIPHFKRFIDRAKGLKPPKAAVILFGPLLFSIRLELDWLHGSVLRIWSRGVARWIDSMARVCHQLSPFFSLIERLDVILDELDYWLPILPLPGGDDFDPTQLLELFRPFTAIQSLHVSKNIVPLVTHVLIGERATEVLPNLRDLFFGGPAIPGTLPEAIQPFVTARQLSCRPVVVHHCKGSTADR